MKYEFIVEVIEMKINIGFLTLNVLADDVDMFSGATAFFSYLDPEGYAVFKDCRGNYAISTRKFPSEKAFKKLAGGN